MTKKVTKAQLNALHRIIGEIEHLQNWLPETSAVVRELTSPKQDLVRAQRLLEREYSIGKETP